MRELSVTEGTLDFHAGCEKAERIWRCLQIQENSTNGPMGYIIFRIRCGKGHLLSGLLRLPHRSALALLVAALVLLTTAPAHGHMDGAHDTNSGYQGYQKGPKKHTQAIVQGPARKVQSVSQK